jgi:diguanylate cyclase (GGDEF)-like protein/putative nucleotidyltransferase with HDIG domain
MSLTLSVARTHDAPSDEGLPFAALAATPRLYIGGVILAAALMLAMRVPLITFPRPLLFVWLVVLGGVASFFKVSLSRSERTSTLSISYAVEFASLVLLGADATMLLAALCAFVQCSFGNTHRNPVYRTIFSMASLALTVQVSGMVYRWFGGVPLIHAVGLTGLEVPLIAAAVTGFVVNSVLVGIAVALSTRKRLSDLWEEDIFWSALSYIVGSGAAAVGAMLYADGHWLVPITVLPVYLAYRTHRVHLEHIDAEERHGQQISELHLATIEALALAIDAKDQTATTHIRRVQVYATELARALGMSATEIQGVRTAALLHDIGKLAVPEHILSKPGPLTPEEFQKIQTHPQIGAEIIGMVPFPYPVAPLILGHHERWDGKGYPNGHKGDEIPLGARILAVVDYFDAITSERSYHHALSARDALKAVEDEAGKAFDPAVADLFVELFPRLEREAERQGEPMRRLSFAANATEGARPAAGFAHEAAAKNVFQDIALAHREIYALYEIAQSLGTSLGVADTMALIASKLSNLVPLSCCALFVYEKDIDTLRCRFATGVDAQHVQQLAVKNGQGLIGWVARNMRALVNARPSAEFESAGLEATTELNSALVCPLVFDGRLIGALAVYHVTPGCYTDDHRRLLDRVAEQTAGVVSNSIVFEETKRDSLTDLLTGLPNTRYMFVHLTRELARAERLKSEVSLLVMDLDGFKGINDRFGHHMGDRALREVARVLRAGIRPYDICVRYAGDEFVVVLSGCGLEEAENKQRELQSAIAAIPFEVRPGRLISLGSSFGCASFPGDGQAYETLLATADKRMYEDKARRKAALLATPVDEMGPRRKRPSVFAKIAPGSASTRTH